MLLKPFRNCPRAMLEACTQAPFVKPFAKSERIERFEGTENKICNLLDLVEETYVVDSDSTIFISVSFMIQRISIKEV
jgi:hypothetical protein